MVASSGYAQADADTRQRIVCRAQAMDGRHFAAWAGLLEERTGLYIAPERSAALSDAVHRGMRACGCQTPVDYYRRLVAGNASPQEWSLLVDRLTVPETRFFRHRASLRLAGELLASIAGRECRRFRALSVGCATGEEVYSLAMLLDTAARGSAGPREFSVTGADISATALQQARSGRYLMRRLAGIPDEFRDRYCRAVSATHFDIVESLRRRVRFAQINVRRQGKRHGERFNLVICQNLLIYYDRARRLEIVDRLAEYLLPGGALILGVGELLGWRHANMEKLCYPDTLAYRRTN